MAKDGKQESLDKFLTQTPNNNNKRSDPFSPDNISPSLLQVQKQARLNSSPTTPEHPSRLASNSDPPPCSEVQDDTVVQLSHVVCATLQNQKCMDQLIPMISQKVIESIKPTLKKMVDDSLLPHIEKIQSAHHVINLQREEIDKQNTIIQTLQDKLDKVEERVEEQEQYSRRTSLRFNNVRVPTNSNGDIIQPIDTDSIVLQICKNQLGVKLSLNDIGRSHPIGQSRDGKISIIVRFLTYRQRAMVFSNKKKLKGNKDKIFICENLTKHRYDMLKRLNTHRINNKVHSYWTHDGSIIVKKSEHSGTKVVRNLEDVESLALGSLN